MRAQGWHTPILIFCGDNHSVLDICALHPFVLTSTSASLLNLFFETMGEYSGSGAPTAAAHSEEHDHTTSPERAVERSNTKIGSVVGEEVEDVKDKIKTKEKGNKDDAKAEGQPVMNPTSLPHVSKTSKPSLLDRQDTEPLQADAIEARAPVPEHRASHQVAAHEEEGLSDETPLVRKKNVSKASSAKPDMPTGPHALIPTISHEKNVEKVDSMDVDMQRVHPSPGCCVASMKPNSRVGRLCTVSIQSRDSDNKLISTGGAQFVVEVNGPVMLEGVVDDHGDGNYTASFFPTRPGSYVVFVKIDGCNIQNSPLRLGSFCSSSCYLHGPPHAFAYFYCNFFLKMWMLQLPPRDTQQPPAVAVRRSSMIWLRLPRSVRRAARQISST